jgi:tetratricopeptide (TPR) repeat protein
MAGFSGEARLACLMADGAPGSVTGVIACGAGFSPNKPPRKGMRFSFFGLAGNTDFNHDELIKLDSTLDDLDVVHRIEVFDGGHEWPPPEWCAEAVEWMELGAMKLNRRPRDETLVSSLFSKRLERAEGFEVAGRVYQAYHQYDSLARDFVGLHDVEEIDRKVALLRDSEEIQSFLEKREKRMERDEAYLKKAVGTLARLASDDPASLHKARTRLSLATLKSRARNTDDEEESLSAQRALSSVFIHAAYYAPGELMERGEYERAIGNLSIASEIRPENPYVWYNLARAQARADREGLAVKSLRKAVENGLSEIRLEEEPDLELLQGRKDFLELIAEMDPKRPQ